MNPIENQLVKAKRRAERLATETLLTWVIQDRPDGDGLLASAENAHTHGQTSVARCETFRKPSLLAWLGPTGRRNCSSEPGLGRLRRDLCATAQFLAAAHTVSPALDQPCRSAALAA